MHAPRRIKTFDVCLAYEADRAAKFSAGTLSPFRNDCRASIGHSEEWHFGRLVVCHSTQASSSLAGFGCRRPDATIEMLPDNVLLEIFDFYRIADVLSLRGRPWRWQKLVHVCQRWRHVVFGSPLRLDLQLSCSYGTPVRKLLGCWPPLPLTVQYGGLPGLMPPASEDEDNIVAALQHPQRIWKIVLTVTNSLLEKIEPLMQEPFPILSHLEISQEKTGWVLPSSFLGGSTPRLRVIHLYDIAFPALPRLHLSVNTVTSLGLVGIPCHAYFSPEAIVTCLSMLSQLEAFSILFQFPIPRHGKNIPPPKRVILPALTSFGFQGSNEYLEDLLAKIDAPILAHLSIKFFNQLIFETPQLSLFICRAKLLSSPSEATVYSSQGDITITLTQPKDIDVHGQSHIVISCKELDWQVSSLAQICDHASPVLSYVERLCVGSAPPSSRQGNDMDMESTQWLELFHPFGGVKVLEVTGLLGPTVTSALQQITEEPESSVFPALRHIHLDGTHSSGSIEQFFAARQITISS
ncbi:hypothetical protein BC827DRAFT_1184257 [Russula dissimulans]|nr:hypothetical protein BC827DRAFT_1184257 [Russula dissimulans]